MRVLVGAALPALVLTAPSAAASGDGGALAIDDSLEQLTSPYLPRYLPGVPLIVNAVGGSNSFQNFDLFEESYDPSRSNRFARLEATLTRSIGVLLAEAFVEQMSGRKPMLAATLAAVSSDA